VNRSWILVGALALSWGALAQAEEEPAEPKARYAVARFVEAARTADWLEARQAWLQLERLEAAPPRLACLAAEVQFKSGEVEDALRLLRPLLGAERPRVDALYLAARIARKTEDPAGAKRYLLAAATHGQAVLHDVGRDPALAPLLREPEFAIQIMEANRNAELPEVTRDPFARRPRSAKKTIVCPPPVYSLSGLRKALARARDRAKARDLEGLSEALTLLRREIEGAEAAARGSAEAVYNEAQAELDRLGELAHSIRLQLFVGRGNQLLRALSAHAEADDLEGARGVRGEILKLCKRFEARNQQIYRLTAARLRTRAEAIWSELEIRQEILALELPIEGVVIPPPEEGSPSRAIVRGLIVSVGDAIAHDGESASPGDEKAVVVKAIKIGAVTFSYRGQLFVRRPKALD
jgi:hypothetical protein